MKTFFGFALSDSMFQGNCLISRQVLSVDEAKVLIAQGVEPCLNPSHVATINAMQEKFGIEVKIPNTAPQITLGAGDSVIVMGVRGLPRLTDRHEYNTAEIEAATFSFSVYKVQSA